MKFGLIWWAVIFLAVAVFCGILGWAVLVGTAATIAKILCIIFVILLFVWLIFRFAHR